VNICIHDLVNTKSFFRITGIYAIVVGFYASLFKFFEWGPKNRVEDVVDICKESWYTNLAYITIYNNRWDMEQCKDKGKSHKVSLTLFVF